MEKKFDRSSFMKVLWKLMLPIVLQNLLSAVTRATLIQRNMDNACKSKGFSTLVISFLLV